MFQLKKRGRQVGADGEKSRKLLLEIAAKQFALHGFHKTKISEIVKEANVTQPTFYLYFKSKDAIFQELIDEFKEKLYAHVEESILPKQIAEDGLVARISYGSRGLFEFFQQNENLTRIGFIVSEEAANIKIQMALKIEENLLEESINGYFPNTSNMNFVATMMVGAIEHLAVTKLWTDAYTSEDLAHDFTCLFLYGLKNNQ